MSSNPISSAISASLFYTGIKGGDRTDCVLRGTKDPFVRVVKQIILTLLDPLHIMLRINDAKISAARRLDMIPASVLLQRDEALKRLMDVAKLPLHSLSIPDELYSGSLYLLLEVLAASF
jgi:hypothetical protein